MSGLEFYDKEGKIISIEEWSQLVEDDDYRVVKKTVILKFVISSVWIGFDQLPTAILRTLPMFQGMYIAPVIFETAVLSTDHVGAEVLGRFASMDEMIEFHDSIVRKVLEDAN